MTGPKHSCWTLCRRPSGTIKGSQSAPLKYCDRLLKEDISCVSLELPAPMVCVYPFWYMCMMILLWTLRSMTWLHIDVMETILSFTAALLPYFFDDVVRSISLKEIVRLLLQSYRSSLAVLSFFFDCVERLITLHAPGIVLSPVKLWFNTTISYDDRYTCSSSVLMDVFVWFRNLFHTDILLQF